MSNQWFELVYSLYSSKCNRNVFNWNIVILRLRQCYAWRAKTCNHKLHRTINVIFKLKSFKRFYYNFFFFNYTFLLFIIVTFQFLCKISIKNFWNIRPCIPAYNKCAQGTWHINRCNEHILFSKSRKIHNLFVAWLVIKPVSNKILILEAC